MKRKRKLLKTLMLGLLCFSSVSLSSCGFLASSESELANSGIESFYLTQNEDGTTTLTITYFEDDREDDVFTIPAGGSEGVDGVSISMITITQDSETECTLTIYLTNSEEPFITFTIPTGASVSDITMGKSNPNSSTGYVTVTFTDGTTQTIDVYYSSKGDTGYGIIAMSYQWDEDGNISNVLILWSDNSLTQIPINSYQGVDGYSITSITSYTDEDNREYHIYITYDYDEGDYPEGYEGYYDIVFKMPDEAKTWYNGTGAPSNDLGKDGDHYFDIKNLVIYDKENGSWVEILAILDYYNAQEKTVQITFDLNDTTEKPAAMTSAYSKNEYGQYFVEVPYNTYFTSVGAIPLPTRSGYDSSGNAYSYTFMGWCSNKEGSPVGGYLTELSACNSDMTYYAIWEEDDL
ncbi:MAG: hypothetical protein LUD22_03310 [Coprobacillus sp.]|nr:hypothetical protein [Coprobacillus sp.]